MKLLVKLCLVLYCYVEWALAADAPIVATNHGSLEGLTLKSRNGNPYYAFRGIPYAEFPGRFEVAKRYKFWDGLRPAKEFGNVCSQIDLLKPDEVEHSGDEDCLFLNVYTPTLDTSAQLPILFWIHGGGYASGSGNGFDGKYFVDENVIVVSINYRLGPLGFLSFGEENESIANIGLKDQLRALKWVNKNIQAFGGDPSKVTIAGYSAGGASVHLHMLSEQSNVVTFGPVIESKGKDSFISEEPESIIHNGGYNKVNWITGFTEDDGAIFDIPIILDKNLTESLEENWEEKAPIVLGYQHLEPSEQEQITKKIRNHYFEHYEIEEMTWSSLREMLTDRYFLEPVVASVEMHSRNLEGRTFPFIFRFAGDYSSVKFYFDVEGDHGISHGDDLQYLFPGGSYDAPDYSGDTPVEIVDFSKKFVKLWASFVHTTEPIDSWQKEPFWKHYSGYKKSIPFYDIAVETGTWDEDIPARLEGLQEVLPRKFMTKKLDKTEL